MLHQFMKEESHSDATFVINVFQKRLKHITTVHDKNLPGTEAEIENKEKQNL